VDVLWVVCGDLFDIHAAFGADQQRGAMVAAVDSQSDVEFLLDIGQFFDEHLLHGCALRPGLRRDQVGRQHSLGCFLGFFRATHQLNATGFAPSTGVYLCLNDRLPAQFLCGRLGLRRG